MDLRFLWNLAIYIISLGVGDVPSSKLEKEQVVVLHNSEDCSDKAQIGDQLSLHYTGKFENGRMFDTSRQEGRTPLAIKLGEHNVIIGMENGVLGMCIGEKRKITIPPHLGYGSEGKPPYIPGDSTLIFEVELLAINRPSTFVPRLYATLSFLTTPAFVIAILAYVYKRYKDETNVDKTAHKTPSRPSKSTKNIKKKGR